MTLPEILLAAFRRGLIHREPPPGSCTILLVDDDGAVVSTVVTHELIDDSPEIVLDKVVRKLFVKRGLVRAGIE